MKKLFFILFLLPSLTMAITPAQNVFNYECELLNKKNLGFSCNGIEGDVQRRLKMHVANTNPTKKKYVSYEFNRFLLRYIDLGGKYIDITYKGWPKNKVRMCTATKNRKNFRCSDCTWVDAGDGGQICKATN